MNPRFPRPAAGWTDLSIMAGCLLLVFGSALLVTYGHSDDYSTLYDKALGWDRRILDWNSASGRPILGHLTSWLFGVAGNVAGLAGLRALGLALLLAVAWMLRRRLLRLGLPRWEALLLATACVLTPSAAVYAGWAITAAALLAGLVALLATELADRAWSARGGCKGLGWLAASLLALVLSLLIYQPLAPLFLFSALLGFAFRPAGERGLRYLLAALAVYLLAVGLYYLFYTLAIAPLHVDNNAAARAEFDLSPIRAAAYVVIEVLPMLLGGWEYIGGGVHPESLPWPVRWTVTMLALALLLPAGFRALGNAGGGKPARRIGAIALVILVWGVSLLPMVILKQHYAPTRALFFSYALVCLLAYLALKRLVRPGPWTTGYVLAALLLLGTQAGLAFWNGLARIHSREYAVLRQAFLAFPERPRAVAFIPPCASFGPDHAMPSRHEYHLYSSQHFWVPWPMVNLVWLDRQGKHVAHVHDDPEHGIRLHLVVREQPVPPEGVPVIDAQALLCGVPAARTAPP